MEWEINSEGLALPYWQEREAYDECGIVAISSVTGEHLTAKAHNVLIEEQHRGREAAGLAYYDGESIKVKKGLGLVDVALPNDLISKLPNSIYAAIGHVRYGTYQVAGGRKKQKRAAAPIRRESNGFEIALGINGHINNTEELLDEIDQDARKFVSDAEALAEVVVVTMGQGATAEEALTEVLPKVNGAFSLVSLAESKIFVARDGHGFRPMVLGKRPKSNGWAVVSESGALSSADANYVRDVNPGELMTIDGNNLFSKRIIDDLPQRTCSMEYEYLARPDSVIDGLEVAEARKDSGRRLALKETESADVVIPVPDSGIPAAIGFAEGTRLPYREGFVKNQVGRTFITPGQDNREEMVRMKLRPIESDVRGKRLFVVEDSIVRGTNAPIVIAMLREAGALEVHFRVATPPHKYPCFYGLATGTPDQLIAPRHDDVEGIRQEIGADSLRYLEVEDMLAAIGSVPVKNACTACFDKDYPTYIDPKRYE